MTASTLRVSITTPEGAERTVTCPLWRESARTDRSVTGRVTEERISNDCSYDVLEPGAHAIRARVDWAAGLSVIEAHAEIRNELAP
jgi:hypothetical protein